MDDDTDSDNEKLPTLELLCQKVKTLMTDQVEVRIKQFKKSQIRKSFCKGPKSYGGEVENLFKGDNYSQKKQRSKSIA